MADVFSDALLRLALPIAGTVLGKLLSPRLDDWIAGQMLKRIDFYFDPDDKQYDTNDNAHHVYRVGVLNRTSQPLDPVWVRVVQTWPQNISSPLRPLQEKDDALDANLEFPASKAGMKINPTGSRPSRLFNVVEKFYKQIPDPRFPEGQRFLDHVYVSVASGTDRHSAIVIPDDRLKRIRLQIDTPYGQKEADFTVKVANGRLLFGNSKEHA